ncbi:hypothetical protein, partial [Bacteroides xylanisolvens]
MINEGQTLKDVGDLLGHKSMEAKEYMQKWISIHLEMFQILTGGAS